VPKSGDDMIFIAFHYGHRHEGGDNQDSNRIQIALVLAHHHAWSLFLSHLQFFTTVVAPV
jgi:hypothetical protein